MFLSLNPSIAIRYLSLNSLTINKKCNLWTDSLITIVYIMSVCIVSIKVMLMMDYISISVAVIVCLVMWWSFLAISGLKRSCPNRLTAYSSFPKNEVVSQLLDLNRLHVFLNPISYIQILTAKCSKGMRSP